MVVSLLSVTESDVQSEEVNMLLIKLIKSNTINDETVQLLHHKVLSKNKYFSFLEMLILGDFEQFKKTDSAVLEKVGIKS